MMSRGAKERTRWLFGIAAIIATVASVPASATSPQHASWNSTASSDGPTNETPDPQARGAFSFPIPDHARPDTDLQTEALARARDLNNRALELQHRGELTESQALYEQCLTVLQHSFGPGHPTFAAALANLAAVYQAKGRFPDAEELYAKSLSILTDSLGPKHYIIAFNLNNLAMLYVSERRNADAETAFKTSLVMLEEALGPEHYATLGTRYNLALLYSRQDRFAEAESLYKTNLAILEEAGVADKAPLVKTLASLEELYVKQGRYGEADILSARIRSLEACKQPGEPAPASKRESCS